MLKVSPGFSPQHVHKGFDHWLLNTDFFFWFDNPKTPHQKKNQYDWLCDSSGKLIVDFVGKVENIDKDFATLCKKINIPFSKKLPRKNVTPHDNYQRFYSQESKDFVKRHFKKDLEVFKYEFKNR